MDGSTDAPASERDAEPTLPTTPSGVTAAMCEQATDLNATGALAGETVTVRGSTERSLGTMAAPCNPSVLGHQVYRYRVRGDNVWLRATTNLPGGTPNLDTVLWVLDGACGEQTAVLECNDDDGAADGDAEGTSTLATRSLRAGTELTFVVGAYARAHRGAASRGEFTLAVTETPSAAPGAECDSAVPGGCVHGYECAATSPARGLCVTASDETEPNNTPAAAGSPRPITGPMAIHAALMPAGDVDCFALAVTAGQSLYIEVSDGGGRCGADLRADLYRAGEADPFDGDDDSGRATDVACPRISPAENTGVRAMAAGTYVLCVRASEPSNAPPMVTLPRYSVQIAPQ
jgi:hypothetical protein